MSLSRVIEVSFNGGSIAYVKADTAYFYNSGIIFKPTDIELPTSYQVHWADSPDKATTLETIGTAEGAPIPDDLWNRSRVIYGWIYLHPTEDSAVTYKEVRIYKNARAGMPDGTEPTPAEQSTIDQLIGALNSAVEQAEDAQEAIENMSVSATTLAEGSSATVTKSEQDGVVHLAFGIPKGQTGNDGYSPTANISKTGKTATITITDKNGTTSAQVSDGTDGTDGVSPAVSVTDITGGHRVVITGKDGAKSFDVEDGATGATPNLTIGTVETLDPTDDATATITGTPENPVLNLGIPQGEQGEVTLEDYYKAFPTDTASGSIASFSDGADDLPLKSLVVDINPVQDLHGQANPYPAGGGKNVFPPPTSISPSSTTTIANDKGLLTISSTGAGQSDIHIPEFTFAESGQKIELLNSFTSAIIRFCYQGEQVDYFSLSSANRVIPEASITALQGKTINEYRIQLNGATSGTLAVMVTPSSDSALSAFSPYENICPISGWTQVDVNHSGADMTNPTTITINLGQTVYGGHLDVLSGELTVYPYYASYNGETLTGEWISDRDKYVSGTTPTIGAQVVNIGAQGVTVQLEPHEVESLYGVNNLWSDSGDTEAVYRADTKLFIERLTAPDSADMIADANITSGQYFMVGNSLYKATANIANGSAIIVGTNAVRKSLSEALNEINA